MEIFSSRLKWLREKNNFSQRDMAKQLEISQPYYRKFEHEEGEPNLKTLIAIAKIFNESIDFVVGLTDYDRTAIELLKARKTFYAWFMEESNKFTDLVDKEGQENFHETIDDLKIFSRNMSEARKKFESADKNLREYLVTIPYIQSETINFINQKALQ